MLNEIGYGMKNRHETANEIVSIAERKQAFALLSKRFFIRWYTMIHQFFVDDFSSLIKCESMANHGDESQIGFHQDKTVSFVEFGKFRNVAQKVDDFHGRKILDIECVDVRWDLIRCQVDGNHRWSWWSWLRSRKVGLLDMLQTQPIRFTQNIRRVWRYGNRLEKSSQHCRWAKRRSFSLVYRFTFRGDRRRFNVALDLHLVHLFIHLFRADASVLFQSLLFEELLFACQDVIFAHTWTNEQEFFLAKMCYSQTVSVLCVVDPETHLGAIRSCVCSLSRAISLNKDGNWPASKHFVRRQRWHFCLTLYRMLHRSPLAPSDRWRHLLYSYNGTMTLRRGSMQNVNRDIYDGLQSIATKECWKKCLKRLLTWWHPLAHLCKIHRRSDRNYDRERDQHTQHTSNRLCVVWKGSIGCSDWLTSLSMFRNAKQLFSFMTVSRSEEAYWEGNTRLDVVRLDVRSVSDRRIIEIEKKSLMIDWMERGENPRIVIAVPCCHNQEFRCFPFPVVACTVPSCTVTTIPTGRHSMSSHVPE